ncbi:MAG: BlaI/MecI/CopY family transcriptional regulator [Myxococcales bacterium]|nr:BlaI/MecI/CopY family transcriptional regulator [Myxococcales bacterium]
MSEAKRPTEAETEILAILWERGPSTVREVHAALEARRGVGYTTVLKLMQIMAHKGLVERDESRRSHVYSALVEREGVQERLVGDLIDRAFAGSAAELVVRALSSKPASKEELSDLRAMLSAMIATREEER